MADDNAKRQFTKPQDFPKQLGSTIHEAILKPVTEGLGGMVAKAVHPLIFGSDGQSGIAGAIKGVFGGGNRTTHCGVTAAAGSPCPAIAGRRCRSHQACEAQVTDQQGGTTADSRSDEGAVAQGSRGRAGDPGVGRYGDRRHISQV